MIAVSGWFDSHAHLQGLEDVAGILSRARAAGVERLVCVGTDLASSREAVTIARSHEGVWATVGLHPHEARHFDDQWEEIAGLVDEEVVVGVGEAGFDLHYRYSPEADQDRAFRAHIDLARSAGKALVVHSREAWAQTFSVLDEEGVPERTVFHCFTGGPAEAEQALRLGAYLSFSGILTFPNAGDLRAAAERTPPERALVETDTPFLAPVPHRGKPNEPALVPLVGETLAGVWDRPVTRVGATTASAAAEVYAL